MSKNNIEKSLTSVGSAINDRFMTIFNLPDNCLLPDCQTTAKKLFELLIKLKEPFLPKEIIFTYKSNLDYLKK